MLMLLVVVMVIAIHSADVLSHSLSGSVCLSSAVHCLGSSSSAVPHRSHADIAQRVNSGCANEIIKDTPPVGAVPATTTTTTTRNKPLVLSVNRAVSFTQLYTFHSVPFLLLPCHCLIHGMSQFSSTSSSNISSRLVPSKQRKSASVSSSRRAPPIVPCSLVVLPSCQKTPNHFIGAHHSRTLLCEV